MKPIETAIDTTLITIGTAYSIANIEQILGLAIMLIQIIWLISKLIYKIYTTIKSKSFKDSDIDEIEDIVDDVIDVYEDIINKDENDEFTEQK